MKSYVQQKLLKTINKISQVILNILWKKSFDGIDYHWDWRYSIQWKYFSKKMSIFEIWNFLLKKALTRLDSWISPSITALCREVKLLYRCNPRCNRSIPIQGDNRPVAPGFAAEQQLRFTAGSCNGWADSLSNPVRPFSHGMECRQDSIEISGNFSSQ